MPKMKTRTSAKKRFKKTPSGEIKFTGAFRRHLLTKKSRKAKRRMKAAHYVCAADYNKVAKLIPYA